MMSNPDTPRRRLAVDLPELEYAFEDASWEASRYLDLETGQVITITGEIRREEYNTMSLKYRMGASLKL